MGLLEVLGLKGWKKAGEFKSLEEALRDVSGGKPLVFGSIESPEPHEYKCRVCYQDGRVYLSVDVPVKLVLGQTVDASVNITPSGTSLNVSGSLDTRNTVEIRLSRCFGYLTGGRDVYRSFSKKDVVADWQPLFAAVGELFFFQQFMQLMQRGLQASREVPVPEDVKERINRLNQIVASYSDRYIRL